MDIIGTFIGWKRFWNAQASVARAKQVFVCTAKRMDDKPSLRRLGIRDAQEPSRATNADPSEDCIVKMCFGRGITDVAKPTAHIVYSLLL